MVFGGRLAIVGVKATGKDDEALPNVVGKLVDVGVLHLTLGSIPARIPQNRTGCQKSQIQWLW